MHTGKLRIPLTVLLGLPTLTSATGAPAGPVRHVDVTANGLNDGSSWEDAFADLQDALTVAQAGDEIWLVGGIYRPDRGTGDRSMSFVLPGGVSLFGGFAGGETTRDLRNPKINETILSGDLNGDDGPRDCADHSNCCYEHEGLGCDDQMCQELVCGSTGSCCDSPVAGDVWDHNCVIPAQEDCCHLGSWNACENSFHVATATGTTGPIVLDGLTVSGAYAGRRRDRLIIAAGLFVNGVRLIINNCTFHDNTRHGIHAENQSDLTVTDSRFLNNFGNAFVSSDGVAALTRCTFEGNGHGFSGSGSSTITDCVFRANDGGASGNDITIMDTLFVDNLGTALALSGPRSVVSRCRVLRNFGAIRAGSTNTTLVNCVFSQNRWFGLLGSGTLNAINCAFLGEWRGISYGGTLRLTNCLIHGAFQRALNVTGGTAVLTNCTITANVTATSAQTAVRLRGTDATLNNCILWGNVSSGQRSEATQIAVDSDSTLTINNSLVEGWTGKFGGLGNFDADPMFIDYDGPDDVTGTEDDDLRLLPGSPAIGAGDNSALPADTFDLDGDGDTEESIPLDLLGLDRVSDGAVNLGAYEGPGPTILIGGNTRSVPEGGTATFSVTLATDPLGPIQITVGRVSGDEDLSVVSGETLSFDSDNFAVPQEVTLGAALDPGFTNGVAVFRLTGEGFLATHLRAVEADADPVPSRVFVKKDAQGAALGTSWNDAFRELRDVLGATEGIPEVSEIWVAGGPYAPAPPGLDPGASFALRSGLALYGGFAGAETDLTQRDFRANETILTGDPNGDDAPPFRNNEDNANHVVTAVEVDATAVLDGFTVTGGNTDIFALPFATNPGVVDARGAGMYVRSASPTVRNCVFRANFSTSGAAVYIRGEGEPTFINCAVVNNTSPSSGVGGVESFGASPTLINCLIAGNVASDVGSLIGNFGKLINCTVTQNFARGSQGGADVGNLTEIKNCIFWGNVDLVGGASPQLLTFGGRLDYCNLEKPWFSPVNPWSTFSGVGNVAFDPLFVDPLGPDGVPGTGDEDFRLSPESPLINRGDPGLVTDLADTDLGGNPRIDGCRVDIGAFESDVLQLSGDFNDDGRIDLADVAGFQLCFDATTGNPAWLDACLCLFDFDKNLSIDLTDYAALAGKLIDP